MTWPTSGVIGLLLSCRWRRGAYAPHFFKPSFYFQGALHFCRAFFFALDITGGAASCGSEAPSRVRSVSRGQHPVRAAKQAGNLSEMVNAGRIHPSAVYG